MNSYDGIGVTQRRLRGFDPAALHRGRLAAGLSVAELARLARVGRRTIEMWESQQSSPQITMLARVCEVIDLPLSAVVTLADNATYPGDIRILRGITQPELAARVRCSPSAIGAIERAESELTDAMCTAVAQELGVGELDYRAAYERARQRPAGEPA